MIFPNGELCVVNENPNPSSKDSVRESLDFKGFGRSFSASGTKAIVAGSMLVAVILAVVVFAPKGAVEMAAVARSFF